MDVLSLIKIKNNCLKYITNNNKLVINLEIKNVKRIQITPKKQPANKLMEINPSIKSIEKNIINY